MYQSLALPNIPLVALLEKVPFLFGNWGFFGQAHSNALVMAYDNFLVEVSLYGSRLDWSYDNYDNLVTKATWFQNLWILVQRFNVVLTFCAEDRVQGLQENDYSLMLEFFQVGYCGKDLISLNTMRKFQNLLHLLDVSKCNGVTLDDFVISDHTENFYLQIFPQEDPTPTDFWMWKEAIL